MTKSIINIKDIQNFNPKHILECGQIFRYKQINKGFIVYSLDKKAEIIKNDDKTYNIITKEKDLKYFFNFFDLNTDYTKIKDSLLKKNLFLKTPIEKGYGIRILKQNPLEMIISFIISANNRISRIQKSLDYICIHAGEKVDDFYAFPTLNKLSQLSEKFFIEAGLGYRAKQIVKAIKQLQSIDLKKLTKLNTQELKLELQKISGVGPKVADCVLLFGFNRKDVFPVDTWINKVYKENLKGTETNRIKISQDLVNHFKELSGYAQQYLFYWKRSLENEN